MADDNFSLNESKSACWNAIYRTNIFCSKIINAWVYYQLICQLLYHQNYKRVAIIAIHKTPCKFTLHVKKYHKNCTFPFWKLAVKT